MPGGGPRDEEEEDEEDAEDEDDEDDEEEDNGPIGDGGGRPRTGPVCGPATKKGTKGAGVAIEADAEETAVLGDPLVAGTEGLGDPVAAIEAAICRLGCAAAAPREPSRPRTTLSRPWRFASMRIVAGIGWPISAGSAYAK